MSKPAKNPGKQTIGEADVESFREHLGPFVVAAETTRMPMVFTDAKEKGNPILFANDSFLSLLGYERDDILGCSFNSLIERGTKLDSIGKVELAFQGKSDADPEIQYHRKSGGGIWASLFVSPVVDQDGMVVQHFASLVDLTKHKADQAHSKAMIDELNHRVKNTLSTVQSIVAQALRNSSDPKVIGEAIESRLFALSRSHDLLTRENWQSAGLLDLVRAALEAFGIANGQTERFKVSGENIHFPPKSALALSIAFHELATNAVKYGALSNETGCVRISWAVETVPQNNHLVLQWRETGGPLVRAPIRKGFGSRVIEQGLAYELEGKASIDYEPDGVVCTIDIPTPQVSGNE